MYNLNAISKELDVNINTLRYHLMLNDELYTNNVYPVRLRDFLFLCKKRKKLTSGRVYSREYLMYIISEPEQFKKEYLKFIDHLKNEKLHKKSKWTETAIECYDHRGNCTECYYWQFCRKLWTKQGCPPMKIFTEKIVTEYGEPTDFDRSRLNRSIITIFS